SFYGAKVAHVDEVGLYPPAQKNLADQSRSAVVGVNVRQNVIARCERLKDRHGRACAGGECRRACATLKRAGAAFQGVAVGIVVTCVHETARVRPFDVALEGRGKVNWGSN